MPAQQDLLSAMRVFQNAANHHDIDLIMETFVARVSLEGLRDVLAPQVVETATKVSAMFGYTARKAGSDAVEAS